MISIIEFDHHVAKQKEATYVKDGKVLNPFVVGSNGREVANLIGRIYKVLELKEQGLLKGEIDIFTRVIQDENTGLLGIGKYIVNLNEKGEVQSLNNIKDQLELSRFDRRSMARMPMFLEHLTQRRRPPYEY
jgi:hypothetical protein